MALFTGHFPPVANAQIAPVVGGFHLMEMRFDESDGSKQPTPQIPKSWRFVAVSNGEKANSNNLWFQDPAGNIICIPGFTSHGSFIPSANAQRLQATP